MKNCWAVNTIRWIKPEIRPSLRIKDIKVRKTPPQVHFSARAVWLNQFQSSLSDDGVRADCVKYLVTLQVLHAVQRHRAVGPEQGPVFTLLRLPETISPSSTPHWDQQAKRKESCDCGLHVWVCYQDTEDGGYVKSTVKWFHTIRTVETKMTILPKGRRLWHATRFWPFWVHVLQHSPRKGLMSLDKWLAWTHAWSAAASVHCGSTESAPNTYRFHICSWWGWSTVIWKKGETERRTDNCIAANG